MYLARAHMYGITPFGDMSLPFCGSEGRPRLLTIVHGAGGVGKTALVHVLGLTRPGHATVLLGRGESEDHQPHARCTWLLGDDDPARPHPLVVATPNARTSAQDDAAVMARREQSLFDRRAREGGFAFLAISSARWFSRQPVALHAPLRTVAHYDVRATAVLDDASRADLTRETKQTLAYAAIAASLMPTTVRDQHVRRAIGDVDMRLLGAAVNETLDIVLELIGFRYGGVDPSSLEPMFTSPGGRDVLFDDLPTRARHLVALAVLPVRTLWGAYPGRDPRTAEGVIAVGEVSLHQDDGVSERLAATLVRALPRAQWILTTSSPLVAASVDAPSILALRRLPHDEQVELFRGHQALTH